MTISEYDGPTAWADMTAVEKMEAVMAGDVAECDEREVFRQAILEAKSEAECLAAMTAAHRESQAEVARLTADLAECYRLSGADPDGNTDAVLALDAVRTVMDLRRDYDQACKDDQNLRAEVARLRAALKLIAGYQLEQFAGPNHMALVCVSAARDSVAALEPTR